ncbi:MULTISPECIES: hypothetical protein [Pseudomonas]|uniref:hypothetical protein n=1 Tax=Pseudomonas TaxID=286 RepID=UPI000761FC54|nr:MULTISPECIES: hypothetical protein [Pseudomonas]
MGAEVQRFTPLCVLSGALTAIRFTETSVELGGDVGALETHTAAEVRSGLGLLLILSTTGFEWISYESVAMHGFVSAMIGAVIRGLFGTRPLTHPVGARGWAVSERLSVAPWQYVAGDTVSVKMLVCTQTGRQDFAVAAQRSFMVGARNDRAWTLGRVMVNGHGSGFVSGLVTVTWRKRDRGAPAVVFDADDVSYGSALTRIVVKSGSNVVKDVAGIAGETWTFLDEQALNGGSWYSNLTFEVSAQKAGFPDSAPAVLTSTR